MVSRFSVEYFLSYNAEIFRRGALLCFKKILVSELFMQSRGESPICRAFCPTGTKDFVGGSLCFKDALVSKICLDNRGITFFISKNFCLTEPKISCGKSSVIQKISGMKNF